MFSNSIVTFVLFLFAQLRVQLLDLILYFVQFSKLSGYQFTVLFTNMRILKFKSQLTIAFFAAVSHLNRPLRKQNFTLMGSKGQGL